MRESSFYRILTTGIALSLLSAVILQIDYYLAPGLSQERYDKLVLAADYVKGHGWKEPILVSYGEPGIWFWSLDRTYLGGRVGQIYTYYGRLQELYFLAPPLNESSYRYLPDTERVVANRDYDELVARFGADLGEIREHPVIAIVPDSYSRPMTETFVSKYSIGRGVYVIPPGALTEVDINLWTLVAAFDYAWKSGGYGVNANWSISRQVLEDHDLSGSRTFISQYRFGTSISFSFTVRIHLMDYPSNATATEQYAPLHISLDDKAILTHYYNGTGPMWLTVQTGRLDRGVHTLDVQTGGGGKPIIVGIDAIYVDLDW